MEQAKLTNQKETLEFLSQKYPTCFFLDGAVKPLKIGIFQDLAKDLESSEVVSKRLLRTSLRHYTSSWRYLAAIQEGTARIDLTGAEVESIEKDHAEHAATQLKESKAKAASLREARKSQKDKNPQATKHKGYSPKSDDKKALEQSNAKHDKTASKRSKKGGHAAYKNVTSKSKPQAKLKPIVPIADTEIQVGKTALVKLGKDPMPVTITDVTKDGVSVQLNSGMTVKVQRDKLFTKDTAS
jgi:ProP effector